MVDFDKFQTFLGHIPKRGTIGCSLSHINFWTKFLSSNFEHAIVFEDDVIFDPISLKKVISQLVRQAQYWDINSFEISHNGTPLPIVSLDGNHDIVVYLTKVSHTGAYIINRKAAQQLLSKAIPILMPVDHYFTRIWELDLKFTGVEPRMVTQQGDSEIARSKRFSENDMSIAKKIQRGLYHVQSELFRLLYNLTIYVQAKFS